MEQVLARWDALDVRFRRRMVSLVLVLGTGFVLALAAWLTPATQGHGTHQQLGLNGCSVLTATGYPCPMCGATTTFAHWAHLQPIQGLINQPFASLLFLMTVATFGISLVETVDPRGRWRQLSDWVGTADLPLSILFLGFMIASWVYKMWLMGLVLGT